MTIETIGDCTLYLGDCRDILPTLGPVDLLMSDTPYGVKERTRRRSAGRDRAGAGKLRSAGGPARDWPAIVGDDQPFDPGPLLAFPKVILFGANHFASRLPDASRWIVWDKREGGRSDDNADCELIWTNLKGPARLYRQLWRGLCCRGEENGKKRLHATQKPVGVMDFCLGLADLPHGSVVLDPYMGSGTSGVAAMRRGLRFIGIECDPTYFETACARMAAEAKAPTQPSPLDDAA